LLSFPVIVVIPSHCCHSQSLLSFPVIVVIPSHCCHSQSLLSFPVIVVNPRVIVVTPVLLEISSASSTSIRSGFRNHCILDPLCSKALRILVLFFEIIWIVEFTRTNSRQPTSFLWREKCFIEQTETLHGNLAAPSLKRPCHCIETSPERHLTDLCALSCLTLLPNPSVTLHQKIGPLTQK